LFRSPSKRYTRRTISAVNHDTVSDDHRKSVDGYGGSFLSRSTMDTGSATTDGLKRVSLHSSIHRLPVSGGRTSVPNSNSFHGSPPPSADSVIQQHNHIRSTMPMDRTNHYGSLRHRGSASRTPTSDIVKTEFRMSHPVELMTAEIRHSRNFENKSNNWGSRAKVNSAFMNQFPDG